MIKPTAFTLSHSYTRADIRVRLGDPGRGGAWDGGYRRFGDEFFVFANVGVAGRTGHDYSNYWHGDRLVWQAKGPSKLDDPQIRQLIGGRWPVHIFTREIDRDPFVYEGLGTAMEATDTTPVGVVWHLDAAFRPPMTADDIAVELQRLGFVLETATVKSQRAQSGEVVLYIKRESDTFVLVADPRNVDRYDELMGIPGVRRPSPRDKFVHNQTFWTFPTRMHTGASPRPYGLDFDVDNREALAAFVAMLVRTPAATMPSGPGRDGPTEALAVRNARLAQVQFRNDLMARWSRRCALTGLPLPELLRASHIKPWRDSSDTERRDVDNGLLLAVHVDGLFDRGLVSFDDAGRLICSSMLDPAVLKHLGLHDGLRIEGLSAGNLDYLRLHRTIYFKTDAGRVDDVAGDLLAESGPHRPASTSSATTAPRKAQAAEG